MMIIKSDSNICIGRNLKNFREQRGLKQVDVVRKLQLLGFSIQPQNYSRIEREQEHIPASVLIALCHILDITLEELFLSN
ncbi:helix-turn-helix domain-containing protein [Hungatella hathewayi]